MSSQSFTCLSCNIVFQESEAHKLHFRSDWHRYNLKRKIANFPPVSIEEFGRRVLQQKQDESFEDKSVYCKFCRKQFLNSKSFTNHLSSKKHKQNEQNYSEDALHENASKANEEVTVNEKYFENEEDIEELDSDEWEDETDNPIDDNNCLFCLQHSRSLVMNLKHMSYAHSFFIPDIEFCTDIKGLLRYLGEKINEGFMCLWCNEKGKTFYCAEATRSHMLDKGHCKMIHEGIALAEYTDFYDYSTSYPDANDEKINVDEEVKLEELQTGNTEYQLVLPSGAVIGHRSLMRYYKQSLNPNREVCVAKNTKRLHKVLAEYKSLGWKATQLELAARNARDIHYMKRLQSNLQTKLSVKANKLQKHFRQQVNF